MAITRKPQKLEAVPDNVDVEALINRGGSVAKPTTEPKPKRRASYVQLRLLPELLQRIDTAIAHRAVPVPRHTWLLEAIAEKLKREGVAG